MSRAQEDDIHSVIETILTDYVYRDEKNRNSLGGYDYIVSRFGDDLRDRVSEVGHVFRHLHWKGHTSPFPI